MQWVAVALTIGNGSRMHATSRMKSVMKLAFSNIARPPVMGKHCVARTLFGLQKAEGLLPQTKTYPKLNASVNMATIAISTMLTRFQTL